MQSMSEVIHLELSTEGVEDRGLFEMKGIAQKVKLFSAS